MNLKIVANFRKCFIMSHSFKTKMAIKTMTTTRAPNRTRAHKTHLITSSARWFPNFLQLLHHLFPVFGNSITSNSITSLLSTAPQHMLHSTNLFLLISWLRHSLPTASYSRGRCQTRKPAERTFTSGQRPTQERQGRKNDTQLRRFLRQSKFSP